MIDQQEIYSKKKTSVIERNERLTALAGSVLFILIIAELVVTANLHGWIMEHIFVGVLLSGPLVVKMFSTGYRFFRYYGGSAEFVRKGPPAILLRLLAPFLVLMTILVFVSGFGLVIVGPDHPGLLFKIHAASVALWIPLTAVHVFGYLRKVPGLIASDWSEKLPGRRGRLGINILALIAGLAAAVIMLPVSAPWSNAGINRGLPSPFVLGIVAAVVGVLVARPLFRMFHKE